MNNFIRRSLFLVVASIAIGSNAAAMTDADKIKNLHVQAQEGKALVDDLNKLSHLLYGLNKPDKLQQCFSDAVDIVRLGLTKPLSEEKGFNSYDYAVGLLRDLLNFRQENSSLDYTEIEQLAESVVYQGITGQAVNVNNINFFESLFEQVIKNSELYNKIASDVAKEKYDKDDVSGLSLVLLKKDEAGGKLILSRINKMMARKEIQILVYRECVATLSKIIDYNLEKFNKDDVYTCAVGVLNHIADKNDLLGLVNFPLLLSNLEGNRFTQQPQVQKDLHYLVVNKNILERVDLRSDQGSIGMSTFAFIRRLLNNESLALTDKVYFTIIEKATRLDNEKYDQFKVMQRSYLLCELAEKVKKMGQDGYKFIKGLCFACIKHNDPRVINSACDLLIPVIGKSSDLLDAFIIAVATAGITINIYKANRSSNWREHVLALWRVLFEQGKGFKEANELIKNSEIYGRGSEWTVTNQDGFVGLVRVLLDFRSKDQTLTNEQALEVVKKFAPRTNSEYCDAFKIFECSVSSRDEQQMEDARALVSKYLKEESPSFFNSNVFAAIGNLLAALFTVNSNDELLNDLCLSFILKCALSEDLSVRNVGVDILKSENMRAGFFDNLKGKVDDRLADIQEPFNSTDKNEVRKAIKSNISAFYIYTLLLQVDALLPKNERKLTVESNKKIFALVSLLLEQHDFNSWDERFYSCGILQLLEAFIWWWDKDTFKVSLGVAGQAIKSSAPTIASYAIGVLVAYAYKVKGGKETIRTIHQELVNKNVNAEVCQTLLDAINAPTQEEGVTLTETFINLTQARAKNQSVEEKTTEKEEAERNAREATLYQTFVAAPKIKKQVKQVNQLIAGNLNLDEMVQNRKNNIPAVTADQLTKATKEELDAALKQRKIVVDNASNYGVGKLYFNLNRMNAEIKSIEQELAQRK